VVGSQLIHVLAGYRPVDRRTTNNPPVSHLVPIERDWFIHAIPAGKATANTIARAVPARGVAPASNMSAPGLLQRITLPGH
jgi:hypothetical protein